MGGAWKHMRCATFRSPSQDRNAEHLGGCEVLARASSVVRGWDHVQAVVMAQGGSGEERDACLILPRSSVLCCFVCV